MQSCKITTEKNSTEINVIFLKRLNFLQNKAAHNPIFSWGSYSPHLSSKKKRKAKNCKLVFVSKLQVRILFFLLFFFSTANLDPVYPFFRLKAYLLPRNTFGMAKRRYFI